MGTTSVSAPAPLGIDLEAERDRSYGIDPNAPRLSRIPLGSIVADSGQPRVHFDERALQGLADSIRSTGLIQPIVVRPDPDQHDRYLLTAGERRYRASRLAGVELIDCIVKDGDDVEEIQLIENIQREDLLPHEEAFAFKRYIERRELTQAAFAKIIGKRQSTVSEILSITTLPESILTELPSHPSVPKSQLVMIAKERDPEAQERLWMAAKVGTLTVERARANAKKGPSGDKTPPDHPVTAAARLANTLLSGSRRLEKLEHIEPEDAAAIRQAIGALQKILKSKSVS